MAVPIPIPDRWFIESSQYSRKVFAILRELAETGGPVFDPYAPSPAGPGRPRKAAAERDTDALIRTLCESLMELLRRTEQV